MRAKRSIKRVIELAKAGGCAVAFANYLNRADEKLLHEAIKKGVPVRVQVVGGEFVVTTCPGPNKTL